MIDIHLNNKDFNHNHVRLFRQDEILAASEFFTGADKNRPSVFFMYEPEKNGFGSLHILIPSWHQIHPAVQRDLSVIGSVSTAIHGEKIVIWIEDVKIEQAINIIFYARYS